MAKQFASGCKVPLHITPNAYKSKQGEYNDPHIEQKMQMKMNDNFLARLWRQWGTGWPSHYIWHEHQECKSMEWWMLSNVLSLMGQQKHKICFGLNGAKCCTRSLWYQLNVGTCHAHVFAGNPIPSPTILDASPTGPLVSCHHGIIGMQATSILEV